MCGIAGLSLSEVDQAIVNPRSLAKRLALAIEHRGRDATGVAFNKPDDLDQVWFCKSGLTATQFTDRRLHYGIPRGATTALVHTRAGTVGSAKDDDNNHPIIVDNLPGKHALIGIHNGVIQNEHELWKKYPTLANARKGEVDSQIIFQMLAAYGEQGLEEIAGDASIAWLESTNPELLHLARLGGRELHIARTVGGSFLFASTKPCLMKALEFFPQLDLAEQRDLAVGEKLTIERGGVVAEADDWPDLTKNKVYPKYSSYPSWNSQHGWQSPTPPPVGVTPSNLTDTERRMFTKVFGEWFAKPDVKEIVAGMEFIYAHFHSNIYDALRRTCRDELAAEIREVFTVDAAGEATKVPEPGTSAHYQWRTNLKKHCLHLCDEILQFDLDDNVKADLLAEREELATSDWRLTSDMLKQTHSYLNEMLSGCWEELKEELLDVDDQSQTDDGLRIIADDNVPEHLLPYDALMGGDPAALGMPDWEKGVNDA